MLSPKVNNIHDVWLRAYEKLKRLKKHEIHKEFKPRQMAGLYAVASICYDDGNHKPLIGDNVFDRLCDAIYEHFDECVKAGADLLEKELVKNHTGYDMRIFVKPYHEIAGILLGHPCQCMKCRNEALPSKSDGPRGGSINIPIPPPTREADPIQHDPG